MNDGMYLIIVFSDEKHSCHICCIWLVYRNIVANILDTEDIDIIIMVFVSFSQNFIYYFAGGTCVELSVSSIIL